MKLSCDNSYCESLIGSHIRAFDWYWPRWPWMILNGVIALILCVSPNLIDFQANYVTVVKDRPIMSVKYRLPVPVFHFPLTQPATRFLYNSWATCRNINLKLVGSRPSLYMQKFLFHRNWTVLNMYGTSGNLLLILMQMNRHSWSTPDLYFCLSSVLFMFVYELQQVNIGVRNKPAALHTVLQTFVTVRAAWHCSHFLKQLPAQVMSSPWCHRNPAWTKCLAKLWV